MQTTPFKVCSSCNRSLTRAEFIALPKPPRGEYGDDGLGDILIHRNCSCGSTLTVKAAWRRGETETLKTGDVVRPRLGVHFNGDDHPPLARKRSWFFVHGSYCRDSALLECPTGDGLSSSLFRVSTADLDVARVSYCGVLPQVGAPDHDTPIPGLPEHRSAFTLRTQPRTLRFEPDRSDGQWCSLCQHDASRGVRIYDASHGPRSNGDEPVAAPSFTRDGDEAAQADRNARREDTRFFYLVCGSCIGAMVQAIEVAK
jgi:hypothetical protein